MGLGLTLVLAWFMSRSKNKEGKRHWGGGETTERVLSKNGLLPGVDSCVLIFLIQFSGVMLQKIDILQICWWKQWFLFFFLNPKRTDFL